MPRSVNTSSVQNAFINLGATNQRYSNLVLANRNRERSEKGQLGGIAGGIIGAKFGGPAGAAAGSAIGSKLVGGDVQDGRTGTNIGVAYANQNNQAEQQERQQNSISALQGARTDAANGRVIENGEVVQPNFFEAFKPADQNQETELPPGQFQVAPQAPTAQENNIGLQDIFPRPNEQSATNVSSVPELDISSSTRSPTMPATQVEQPRQNINLSTLATAPLASTGKVPGQVQFGTPFEQIVNQQENQLAIEQAALNDPRLSRFPSAFSAQQQKVNSLQNQVNQAKIQFASMREKQILKNGGTGARVSDSYAGFLSDLSKFKGTEPELNQLSDRLLGLYNENKVDEKDFKKQAEFLTQQKIESIDRNFKQSEAISKKAFLLSDRFDKETKKPRQALESADKIIRLGKLKDSNGKLKTNGIRDLAQIVGFLKTIDPGSVARESEVDAVRGAVSYLGQFESFVGKGKDGALLTSEQKEQIEEAAQVIKNASMAKVRSELDSRIDQARNNGVPIKNIFSTRKIFDSFDTSSLSKEDKNALRDDIKAVRNEETGPDGRQVTIQDLEIAYGLR